MTNNFFTSIIQFVILGVKEMKWTLKEIQEHRGEPLQFDETVNCEASLMKRDREILAVSDIKATGFLLYENRSVLANFQIDYTITLPSSRSLEPVELKVTVPIFETYVEDESSFDASEESVDVIIPIENNEVDLTPAIEDMILLNIPVQVFTEEELSSEEMPKGANWSVVSEDDYQQKRAQEKEDQVDPRLADLKALLEDEENER